MKNCSHSGLSAITVGRISYMNVAPVYYGLDNGSRPAWLNLTSAPPSVLNKMLADGIVDVSPVSSAAYARHQDDWLLLPDLSISCFGKVMSVLLVSRYPLSELSGRKVILTEDSETAAMLLRLLFAFKQIYPIVETGRIRRWEDFSDNAAALVIGDAALKEKWSLRCDYIWDLGECWNALTGLPFVFALWAVRKSYAQRYPDRIASVSNQFAYSKYQGTQHIESIIWRASKTLELPPEVCRQYYHQLNYDLENRQIRGLETFFMELYRNRLIHNPVRLLFFNSNPS